MKAVGLDLGGTKLASALFDENGAHYNKQITPLNGRSGQAVGALIVSKLNDCLSESDDVTSVGISIPGIYFSESGRVWVPNIAGWEEYPLLEQVRTAVDKINRNISISIDNDRACYILGETWRGAAKDCKDAIYIAVGTGIGAGILSSGRIIRGAGDIAGSIGWMALQKPYLSRYEACGCFEYHASGEGIARVARDYMKEVEKENWSYDGELKRLKPAEITAREIFELYDNGDPIARRITEESIELWGMAVANLISIFNPEKVIFGGGVFGPAGRFLPQIEAEARKWAQPISFLQTEIALSTLGGEAGLIGAGRLALLGSDSE